MAVARRFWPRLIEDRTPVVSGTGIKSEEQERRAEDERVANAHAAAEGRPFLSARPDRRDETIES